MGDSVNLSANNLAYWISNPISREEVFVLRRIKEDRQGFFEDRFEVAHLIALECVEADVKACTLKITKKGLEGFEVFKDKLTKLSEL